MTVYEIHPDERTLVGSFSRDYPPILEIDSGDTVVYETLDASWSRADGTSFKALTEADHAERNLGHAMCGPVAVRDAEPGDVLEIRIERVRPGPWGWTWAGPRREVHQRVGIEDEALIDWRIDVDAGRAAGDIGMTVPIAPFMGVMGNAPAEPGVHSSVPPRRVGGNIDCRELIAGSTLWLPVEMPGALFSVGDGHAAQGDGEVAQTAIECPMEEVRLTFYVCKDLEFAYPRANTPAGYATMGFGATLEEATATALAAMLDHIQAEYGVERAQASALASTVVSLRVTQIVNEVVGVHAVLPQGAIEVSPDRS